MKTQSLFLFLFLMAASFLVHAQVGDFQGTYQRGDATNLQEGAQVRISRLDGKTYDIVGSAGSRWTLPVEQIRGAQASVKGLWLYWFEGENTRHAFFEMSSGADILASTISKDVLDYHQQPVIEDAEAKARYELYRDQAIRQSK